MSETPSTHEAATEVEVARLRRRLERERQAREEAELIAERATRELYERQRELALVVTVARAVNVAVDVTSALQATIDSICEYTGWPVGHVYLADSALGLRASGIWHIDRPEQFREMRRVTEETSLASGVGLGGRVLASGEPIWLPDVTIDPNFPRARLGADIGVRAGFGFPIRVGPTVAGVMEFFTETVQPENERLLKLMAEIGTGLGRAIERERASEEVRVLNGELAARAQELERSNAELQEFASIASHDLQEPLRKVQTFTARVVERESENLSESGQDYLARASSAAARMQTLINDLLALSRVTTRGRPFAAVDLAEVTADVLSDLEQTITDAGATVAVGALPTIDADGLQMRQLIQNLLTNACKFRRSNATLHVSIEALVHDDTTEITVRDNGIGFDPQYQERIFKVFERLHGRSEYPGTGIGLALCRKIAERHGGTIDADGEPDLGARFTVHIPAASSSAVAPD